MLRSVLAVLAGYFVMVVLVMTTFAVLAWVYPEVFSAASPELQVNKGWLLAILTFSTVYAVLGGYMTAALARRAELKHATALAGLVLVMGVVSRMTNPGEPLWLAIALPLSSAIACLAGGALRARLSPSASRR